MGKCTHHLHSCYSSYALPYHTDYTSGEHEHEKEIFWRVPGLLQERVQAVPEPLVIVRWFVPDLM